MVAEQTENGSESVRWLITVKRRLRERVEERARNDGAQPREVVIAALLKYLGESE